MAELEQKINMVKEIGETLSKIDRMSIVKMEYDVFTIRGYREEYLVVTYKGGAIAARNCNGNSCYAIFEEIAKLANGGYYDEVKDYRTLKAMSEENN